MRIPRDDPQRADTGYFVAAEEAGRLREEAAPQLDRAVGVGWYEEPGSAIDEAALTLCRLRRARGGEKGGPEHGDEAVRLILEDVSKPALVWLASRAISYMDETGFPEAVEPWFPAEASS
jgi:hypothetical protein